MKEICVVITEHGEAASVLAFLKLNKDDVTALVIGSEELAKEASTITSYVKWVDTNGEPADNYASAAADAIVGAAPAAIIGVASPCTRTVLGVAAAKTGASTISNVTSVSFADDHAMAEHSILGDKQIETLEIPAHACLLVSPLSLKPQENDPASKAADIERIAAESSGDVEYISVEPAVISGLKTAEYIVGVGLGATAGDLFDQAKELARVMGAEMGCSMPVFNELQLMPHEAYIGLTGTKVAPKLYLALGISGTSQHCAGVRNAKTIVCVNKDPKALFFDNADYGLVGDLAEIIPELISALK